MERQDILNLYQKQRKKGKCTFKMLANTMAYAFDLNESEAEAQLKEMMRNGDFVFDEDAKSLRTPQELGLVQGVLSKNAKGYGFVRINGQAEDIFVPSVYMGKALNGDRVLLEIVDDKFNADKVCGIIRAVTGHTSRNIVGTVQKKNKRLYLLPDESDKYPMIEISPNFSLDALPNDKVVVKVQSYEDRFPVGEVVEILGDSYEASAQIKAILRSFDLYENYPEKQVNFAKKIPQEVQPEQLKGRLDLTEELIFTIDGDDAKDFDDAISLSMNEDGTFRLGVHIADVSEYVKPNSVLAEEAYERGTSTYLPRLVLPMLPNDLSNGICSLKPQVVRLTVSSFMDINHNGEVTNFQPVISFIKSQERMTYKNFQKILDGDKEMCLRYPHLIKVAKQMKELSDILEKNRVRRGELDFDLPETQINLDEDYNVVDITPYPVLDSNKIIESFMVINNEEMAKFFEKNKLPGIYRVHGTPDPDRLEAFNRFLGQYGLAIKVKGNDFAEIQPKDFQKLLKQIEDKEYGEVIRKVALRSTKKAYYDVEDLGHFALANENYCHFTSPIRRLPDLICHTILKEHLRNSLTAERKTYWDKMIVSLARNASEKERVADDAERAVNDYYKCKYMANFLGEEFVGKVNGVTSDRIFVELPNTVEGAIKIADLPYDNYILDEDLHRLDGKYMSFKMGDTIKVRVLATNDLTRTIDFGLVKDFVKQYDEIIDKEPTIKKKMYEKNGESYFIDRRSSDESRKEYYERIGFNQRREERKARVQAKKQALKKKSQQSNKKYEFKKKVEIEEEQRKDSRLIEKQNAHLKEKFLKKDKKPTNDLQK